MVGETHRHVDHAPVNAWSLRIIRYRRHDVVNVRGVNNTVRAPRTSCLEAHASWPGLAAGAYVVLAASLEVLERIPIQCLVRLGLELFGCNAVFNCFRAVANESWYEPELVGFQPPSKLLTKSWQSRSRCGPLPGKAGTTLSWSGTGFCSSGLFECRYYVNPFTPKVHLTTFFFFIFDPIQGRP